ncbi:glutaredoxin family protein [Halopseudomonas pelagia]|uniref:glutaredoxin family protein n=1 Tax=Halopseudomonas pelagia TaxID=553151 RepID=UPI0005912C2E|nr:glutaredoxin family protein [Halopseudomonas pelagia]
MQTDPQLTLYGTQACHLCEEASSLLALLAGNGVQAREQDITNSADSAELMARYQLRIPVLRREDTGAELDWPFTLPQLMEWLGDVLAEEG